MHIAIRSLTRLFVVLPTVMLAACGSDDGGPRAYPAPAEAGQEFVLGFGETIRVAGMSLEFTTLAEESRCPMSATCAWEGTARVLITATRGRVTSVLELSGNAQFPEREVFEGYSIELRRVDPYPETFPLPPADVYTVTLFIEAAAP